jgi:aldose 1-epimerase
MADRARAQASEDPGAGDLGPTGRQHHIGSGRQLVAVTEVGATLRSYTLDGVELLDGSEPDEVARDGRGQVLAPWPNRLGDGRYEFRGRQARAALDEPERRNAIHGLVRWLGWELVSRAQNVVTLACTLHPQPGYPWRLHLEIEYRLVRTGLVVQTRALNRSSEPAPFGLGFHPYVRALGGSVDTTRLTVPARSRIVTDERGLPVGRAPVVGTEYDFSHARSVGPTRLDLAYGDLVRQPDGTVRVLVDHPGSGPGVELWADAGFTCLMAYTGDRVEPAGRRRQGIALEPMTCPPDALRTGDDLIVLEPGVPWEGSWGLSPQPLG